MHSTICSFRMLAGFIAITMNFTGDLVHTGFSFPMLAGFIAITMNFTGGSVHLGILSLCWLDL